MDTKRLLDTANRILVLRHMGGKHSQKTHGKKKGGSGATPEQKVMAKSVYSGLKAAPTNNTVLGGPDKFYNTLQLLSGSFGAEVVAEMANLYENDADVPKPATLSIKPSVKSAKNITHKDTVKAYKSWTENLSDDEKLGLGEYQRGDYQSMNNYLRKGEDINSHQKERVKNAVSALQKTSIPQDTILYRGTDTDVYKAELGNDPNQWIGKTFTDKGFLSTSIEKSASFGGTTAKVLAPKGTKGGYLGNLPPPHRHNEGEKEMLLPPGTKMRIIGVNISNTGAITDITTEVIDQ